MKSSYIRILFVVVALIYSVQSNDCSKCWNVGETKCCGNQTMTCPESSCMTISELCTVDGIEHKTVRKTCGDNTTCGSCFSISTNQGLTLRTSTQCRKGYKSNANLNYKITCEALEKENGYWCPACYKNNSMDGCEATHTINCKGAETACLEFRGVIQIAGFLYLPEPGGLWDLVPWIATEYPLYLTTSTQTCSSAMKFLLEILLLSAIISTGYSLTCISCTSTTQTPCTGSVVTCASNEDVCTSVYTETKLSVYGITSYAIVRGCGVSSECNIPKSLSNQFMAIDINTGCCSTDSCSPTAPIVSPVNTNTNGLACPSCFSLTSSTCVADTQIDCTGNENKCTTYSITTATNPPRPMLAMAGCATDNMCSNYNGTATSSVTGQMNISIGCGNATKRQGKSDDPQGRQ